MKTVKHSLQGGGSISYSQPTALVLTQKAIREIILALRSMRYSTEKQREYARKQIAKLMQQQVGGK